MTTFKSHTFQSKEMVAAASLQAIQDSIDAIAPVGSYLMVHMTPPAGGTLVNGAWLACDGTSVSASTYVDLFNKIGTTYGGGGGSFTLPDFRGRMPLVAASGGNSDASLGKNEGQSTVGNRRPKHSHTVASTHSHSVSGVSLSSDDSHAHDFPAPTVTAIYKGGSNTRPYGSVSGGGGGTTGPASALHSHTLSGTMNAASTSVTAVGISGLTDTPSYLVCCTILIRAL